MLNLLSFPDFTEAFITDLSVANVADLLIKVLELLSFRVGRGLDRSLLWDQGHFKVGVFVGRAVEDADYPLADSHIVLVPRRIEQNAVGLLDAASREGHQGELAVEA